MESARIAYHLAQSLDRRGLDWFNRALSGKHFAFVASGAVAGGVLLFAGWCLGSKSRSSSAEDTADVPGLPPVAVKGYESASTIMSMADSMASISDNDGEHAENFRMALVVRSDLHMGVGEITSQCCRAFWGEMKKAQKSSLDELYAWEHDGHTLFVHQISGEDAISQLRRDAKKAGVICHTTIHKERKQKTAMAIGPARSDLVVQLTGHLEVL